MPTYGTKVPYNGHICALSGAMIQKGEEFSFVQSRIMRLPNTNGYLQVIALILQEHGEAFGSNSHPYI